MGVCVKGDIMICINNLILIMRVAYGSVYGFQV